MFRSAVFKLTAAFVAIVMTICVAFSVVLYRVAIQELHAGFYSEYSRWFNAFQPFGLRQPGEPTAEFELRAHHIFVQIIYFNLLVLGVTALTSYILARRTLRPIEAAHDQQKRFTADVSHELRTPLTSMKMETEVALINPRSRAGELRDTLTSNLEEIGRMEILVNNLLLLSSMEAGKLRTEFKNIDLSDAAHDAVRTVAKSAEAKHINIETKLDHKSVAGDRSSLTQLFVILLENAVKYSPEGSTVTVSMRKGRGRLAIEIRDSGPGIPGDALPHIFDRFYRADSSRVSGPVSGKPDGFGLGLSLAKLIADLHSGEIVISSTPGKGTTARVILPAAAR